MSTSVFQSHIYHPPYNETFSLRNRILITSAIFVTGGWILTEMEIRVGIIILSSAFIGIIIHNRIDFGDRPVIGEPIASLKIDPSGIQIAEEHFAPELIKSLTVKSGHWKDRRTRVAKNYFDGGTENTLTLATTDKIIQHHFMVLDSDHSTVLKEALDLLAEKGVSIQQ